MGTILLTTCWVFTMGEVLCCPLDILDISNIYLDILSHLILQRNTLILQHTHRDLSNFPK